MCVFVGARLRRDKKRQVVNKREIGSLGRVVCVRCIDSVYFGRTWKTIFFAGIFKAGKREKVEDAREARFSS